MDFQGNDRTPKRKVIIKCRECRAQQTIGGIITPLSALANVAVHRWNTRAAVTERDQLIGMLRYLFYYRLPLGNKLEDLLFDFEPERWAEIQQTLAKIEKEEK